MRSTWSGRLFFLFLIVPITELALLIWMGERFGLLPTVGLVAVTALVGSWLARREGLSVLNQFQSKLASGALPGRELTDGLIILVSAALLLTPGILTDAVGFFGLFPPTRALIRVRLQKRLERAVQSKRASVFVTPSASAFTQAPAQMADAEIISEH